MEQDDQQSTKEQNPIIKGPSTTQTLTGLLLSSKERKALSKLRPKRPSTSPMPPTLPPPPSNPLSLPLAVPQLHPTPTSAHLLAFSSSLPLPCDLFLQILQTYNLALRPTPPTQLLDAIAGILGLVPEPHVQLTSHILGATAAVGEDEVARVRGAWVLEQVNRGVFRSRGLRMEVVRGKELGALLGVERLPVMGDCEVDGELDSEEDEEDELCERHPEAENRAGRTNAHRRALVLINAGLAAPLTFPDPSCLPQQQQKEPEQQQQSKTKPKYHRYLAKEQAKELTAYGNDQTKKRAKRREEKQVQAARWQRRRAEIEAKEMQGERLEEEKIQKVDEVLRTSAQKESNMKARREVEKIEKAYVGKREKVAQEAAAAAKALEDEMRQAAEKKVRRERKKMEELRWLVVRNL